MKTRPIILVTIVLLVGSLAAVAYFRSGLLNLPEVADGITPAEAGLSDFDRMRLVEKSLENMTKERGLSEAAQRAIDALDALRGGDERTAINGLEDAVRLESNNLVLGNTLRMTILKLKRKWLQQNAGNSEIALKFPDYLQDEPVRFFRELAKSQPNREVKFQLALSLVDHMLLFPALEIKAPSSVEAVEILTDVLEKSTDKNQYYVPALYARGLNYLNRPFNLVWPERIAAPVDAASKDLSTFVAIGRKVGGASDRLSAELSLTLGDAYAKEGKLSLARSWWQIANNLFRDDSFRERVFARLRWNDDDVATKLEETLGRQMEDLDHPLSDLRFMWE